MAEKKDAGRLTPEKIITRYKAADARFEQWRSLYELCYRYACPQRNLLDGQYEGGTEASNKLAMVFDSTAIASLDRFANRMQSGVFPPQRVWARLEPGTDIPPQRRAEVKKILEAYTLRMFAVMRSSNFDIAMGEFLLDMGIGTACMIVQPGDDVNPVNYTCVPPWLVRFEEDAWGRPSNVYRKLKVKPELIKILWKGAELDDELTALLENKPHEEVELMEATVLDPETGRWHYHVLRERSQFEVYHRRQKYSNWVISRYSKLAGEIMGRGPVTKALPDIRTLNKVKELILKNASIAVSGVWTGQDDGVLNPKNVKIVPGAVIPVARNGGPQGPSLQALKTGADFNVAQIVLNDLVGSIKKVLLDESLPPDTASARSATEIIERMKELAQNLGSAFGRLIDEVMIPVVETTLQVLDERGVVEFPLKVNGREVKVTPVAPLAMAQFMDEVDALVKFAMIAQQLGPEGQVAVNTTEAIDWLQEKMGIPVAAVNDRDTRALKMKEVAQQAAAMLEAGTAAAGEPAQPAPVPA